jgi:hypothetical protein
MAAGGRRVTAFGLPSPAMEDDDLSQLRSEWRTLKGRDRRRIARVAISGQPAEDDVSLRMVSYFGRKWVRQAPLRMALHAAAGRFLLAAFIVIALVPGVTFNMFREFSFPRLFVWILGLVWVCIAASFVPVGRRMRSAAKASQASEGPSIGNSSESRPPLSGPAGAIISGELVLLLAVVLLSTSEQDFSGMWAAYFAVEAVLLAATLRFSSRRRA